MDSEATRQRLITAVLTGSTCGEACWSAAEDVCKCSCGGKNHGILKDTGKRPERTCKIQGRFYKLAGVGTWLDIRKAAYDYNVPTVNGQHDYNNSLPANLRAIDKPATASQLTWDEVKNTGINRPSLLWIPNGA